LSILLAILIFGALIFIHELGHFVVARLCGVRVLEFSIGMGPKLISIASKKSGTVYSVRLLPLGGYVNMLGENGMEAVQGSNGMPEEAEEETDDRKFFTMLPDPNDEVSREPTTVALTPEEEKQAYCNQSVWKRILISVAGPAMNLILGFVLMIVLVCITKDSLGTTVVHSFPEQGATSIEKLQVGDEILKVDGTSVHSLYELSYEISDKGYRPVDLTVRRNGEKIVLEDVAFPVTVEQGTPFGMRDFYVLREQNLGVFTLIKHAFWRSVSCVRMVFDSITGLFTKRYAMESVSGPVGITGMISEVAKQNDWLTLFHMFILISINLGVMNLLPIPALDGGHLLIYAIEVVRRKRLKPEVEGIINLVGLVLMLGLMIAITVKDVIAL